MNYMSLTTESLPTWARYYGSLGWPIFPCRGKMPLIPNGWDDASADADQIDAWWERWPDANIALRPSQEHWVLDADPRHNSQATLDAWQREHGAGVFPAAPMVHSGRGGGCHWHFSNRAGASIQHAASVGQGINILAKVGALLPPSIHPDSHRPYRWATATTSLDLTDAPAWLVALVAHPAQERPATRRDHDIPQENSHQDRPRIYASPQRDPWPRLGSNGAHGHAEGSRGTRSRLDAATVASGLHKARKQGDGWQACCPAHDDQNASLSIRDGEKGILLYCHAGCTFPAILSALGLEKTDLCVAGDSWEQSAPRIVATYDYVDAAGALRYQVVRQQPKGFYQRRPDPSYPGEWIANMRGVEKLLYRLPAVLAAETVYVVEGEKDADRLASAGVCATTNVGGAGKWLPSYTAALAGKAVILLPDNDDPGRAHMQAVAKALQGVAASVQTLHLPVPPKGDVSDWLDAGHTPEEFGTLLARAAPENWKAALLCDKDGSPKENVGNLAILLLHLPEAQALWWDSFAAQAMLGDRPLQDEDVVAYARATTVRFRCGINRLGNLYKCLLAHAKRTTRDPLQDYIQGLTWDHTPRLDTWLADYCEVDDTPGNCWIGATLCCALVARALSPGCQQRYVVILEGPENGGKSKLCTVLGAPWSSAITSGFDAKETIMAMRGCWLMEIEELNAMRRSEEAAVKAFVTRCEDRLILKYANEPSVYQRRTVLVGTVNPQADGFLRGVRDDEDSRYLPVTVGKIDVEGVAAVRDQLFAEAKERILSGIPWWEQDVLARDNVQDSRRARQESNIYESAIREWLPLRATAEYITIAEVMERALDITQKERWSSKSLQMQVSAALKACGWSRTLRRVGTVVTRAWIENDKENQIDRDIPF